MDVQIFAKQDDLRDEVRASVEQRIRRALRRWPHRVAEVRAFLQRERRSGSLQTTCRLVLDGPRGGSITTTGSGRDAEEALLEALPRARRRIRREAGRRRTARFRFDRKTLLPAS